MAFVTEVRRLAGTGDVPVAVPAEMALRGLLERMRRVNVTGEADAPRILVDDRAELERRLAEAVTERDARGRSSRTAGSPAARRPSWSRPSGRRRSAGPPRPRTSNGG